MSIAMLMLAMLAAPALADEPSVVQQDGRVVAVDAARAPRSAAMIGSSCSFRTGTMARRVVSEGDDYAYMGTLQAAATQPDAVACPYRIGAPDGPCVVATELVEDLEAKGLVDEELSLEGRTLEVDGVRYVVLTAYQLSDS